MKSGNAELRGFKVHLYFLFIPFGVLKLTLSDLLFAAVSWLYLPQALSSLKIQELCFPLAAIVDFRGFRLLALSLLPLGSSTLKYGR
jgi:hypothetical protein